MDNLSVYWESIPTGRENDVATERKDIWWQNERECNIFNEQRSVGLFERQTLCREKAIHLGGFWLAD